nr:MAG TPA: hypothetical protein [Caudoviricetes sp.]
MICQCNVSQIFDRTIYHTCQIRGQLSSLPNYIIDEWVD